METKKAQSLRILKDSIEFMACPVCKNPVSIHWELGIVCRENHCFDVSKKGYLNILRQPPKENYERALFEARSEVIKAGLYDPLLDKINSILRETFESNQEKTLLDAGCGEGSHLNMLSESLRNRQWKFFGLDIAKEGIGLATNERNPINWLVGDLSDLPFKDGSLDVILNILSPGHYESFKRVLKAGGRVIKVIPTELYLKEIRQALYPDKSYSHALVQTHFTNHFSLVEEKTITYDFQVSEALKPKLLAMTPLTWQHELADLLSLDLKTVTVSFVVLVGKK